MPESTNVILSLEKYPVCPVQVSELESTHIITPSGDMYTWYSDGAASILSKDGSCRYFWNKPTLKRAIENKLNQHSSYIRFFQDGSVENKINNQYYWWGPTIQETPIEGEPFDSCGLSQCCSECKIV